MATTSPDNIRTPDAGDQYALVQDLGLMADTVQDALTLRANSYVGTAAQRNAFTTAPDGSLWQDTDGSRIAYIRFGGEWISQRGSAARIYGTADQVFGQGSETQATFQASSFNHGGIANIGQNVIVTDKAGLWQVSAGACFGAKNTLESITIGIAFSGGIGTGAMQGAYLGGQERDTVSRVSTSALESLPAGTQIRLNVRGYTSNGSDVRVYGTSRWSRWLAAVYVGEV